MREPKSILALETSGPQCSVALSVPTSGELVQRIAQGVNDHSARLTLLIEECMQAAGLAYDSLDAVAVSNGPGSYTGLRIGLATAKGLCFALGLPLIPLGTLQVLAAGIRARVQDVVAPGDVFVPLMDARRMEVYIQAFDADLQPLLPAQPAILPEQLPMLTPEGALYVAGSGLPKALPFLKGRWVPVDDVVPSAEHVLALAMRNVDASQQTDVAYVEPYYLKEFQSTAPRSVPGLPDMPPATADR